MALFIQYRFSDSLINISIGSRWELTWLPTCNHYLLTQFVFFRICSVYFVCCILSNSISTTLLGSLVRWTWVIFFLNIELDWTDVFQLYYKNVYVWDYASWICIIRPARHCSLNQHGCLHKTIAANIRVIRQSNAIYGKRSV